MDFVKQILAANNRIKTLPNMVRVTPLEKSLALTDIYKTNVYLKYENLQLTGSFKLRGATNKISMLSKYDKAKGVITASSGNHGLGVAMAAYILNVEANIYVPKTVSPIKLAAIKQLGATVHTVNGDAYLAETTAKEVAKLQNKTYISPYNDMDVICGQGSVGVEIIQQKPDIDAIFIAVGGGGLIGGIGTYVKSLNPKIKIIGCWPEVAKSFYHALEDGVVRDVAEEKTLSDGTAGGVEPDTITLDICQNVIDEKVLVTEKEIAQAVKLIAEKERHIIEGSAGVALAAALKAIKAHPYEYSGKNIAIVICGRNISLDKFLTIVT